MGVCCALYGCLSRDGEEGRSFFRFPKDEKRCKQWIVASGRPDLAEKSTENLNKSYHLCDLHFRSSDRLKKNLKRGAIPTQNLPQDYEDRTKSVQTVYSFSQQTSTRDVALQASIPRVSDSTQTTQELSTNSPPKKNLLTGKSTECKKCTAVHKKECDISPQLKKMIDVQNQLKPHGSNNKHDKSSKTFALNIFLASPLAYRILANALCLPSERILRRMKIDVGTKLHANALKYLESKFKNLEESGKYCIISANAMLLKRNLFYQINEDKIVGFHEIDGVQTTQPATWAYVIMARGVYSNWKQPLAYCLLTKSEDYAEVNIWLDDLISKILNIGFHVVAFVSDQSSNFLNLSDMRNVSEDKPYFYIGENKIYIIFDVPHLIKSVRNNLMKYDFEFSEDDGNKLTAKWGDVKAFYRHDCERAYRLAPKLTESHINPKYSEKKNVKYATQVFSNTVAAAMSCSIECNRLTTSASGTVKFIDLMDKSFDVLNSSKFNDPNTYKSAFADKPYQTEILDRLDYFLSNVTVVDVNKKDVTNSVECLKGWKININSIRGLTKDLQSKGFSYLFTRRLNQDDLDNFFESVGKQGGNYRKPTPIQFNRAFNKLYMTSLLRGSIHANCSEDLDQLLMDIDNLGKHTESNGEPNIIDQTTSSLAVQTIDYRLDLPERSAFLYVCGYLLKKCVEVHKCETIIDFIKRNSFLQENMLVINPPESFVESVKSMDEKFKLVFKNPILNSVGNDILNEISDISVTDCCDCFPNMYLRKLFIRLRIYNVIRFNNRLFKDKSLKEKNFCVNDL